MLTKLSLFGQGSFSRHTTVILPDGISQEDFLAAMNSPGITVTPRSFDHEKFKAVITANSFDHHHQTSWTLESVVTEEESESGCCGCGGCASDKAEAKSVQEEAKARQQAILSKVSMLATDAFEYVHFKDTRTARRLIAAASALYEKAGGGVNDSAMWLLALKSFICSAEGKHKTACKYAEKSVKMALAANGAEHTTYAVASNNAGEVLFDGGQYQKAESNLRTGIGIIDKAIAGGKVDLKWAADARADAVRVYVLTLRALGRDDEAAALVA